MLAVISSVISVEVKERSIIKLQLFKESCVTSRFSFHSAFNQINLKSISFEDQPIKALKQKPVEFPGLGVTVVGQQALSAATSTASFDATECQSQHSIISSELNLNSLSSDSGLHTGKTSEMSSGDFNSKIEETTPSNEDLASSNENNNNENNVMEAKIDSNGSTPIESPVRSLTRTNSVKNKVGIFQDLENRMKTDPKAAVPPTGRPVPKKSECLRHLAVNKFCTILQL